MSTATVLRSARIGDTVLDALVVDGTLRALGPDVAAPKDAEHVALDGRWLLPGLWDNHVHAEQHATARVRLDVAGAGSAAAAAALVRAHLADRTDRADSADRADRADRATPLVGFGFRDALWPDTPTRALLDDAAGGVPVVLVSADLHCGWLNTAAARHFGAPDGTGGTDGTDGTGGTDGLLRESVWQAVHLAVADVPADVLDRHVLAMARAAAARGVVGIVDFEAPWQLDAWARRLADGAGPLRVVASVWPSHLHEPLARGLRTADPVPGTGGLLTMGPLKVITDGSLNTRTAYCHDPYPGLAGGAHPCGMLLVPPDQLRPLLARATAGGLDVAVHAIGDRANELALDAFAATGARGRIEHAQLLSPGDVGRFAALGVGASIQPEHAVDDRDVADRYWAGRTHRAFAYRTLLDSGAELALGSDAPVAPLDPWVTLAAAVHRSGDERPAWHPEQHIPLATALAASWGPDGPLRPGRRADLVVTERDPATATPRELRTMPVAATMLGGRWSHRAGI